MTIGEKIQFFRKKNGLSQEDLGQKLLVSRQTVSLWEMDKTLPTVDNLIRLKEIFGVSVDDMLTESNLTEVSAPPPKEKYRFTYSSAEMKEVFRIICLPIIKKAILGIISNLIIYILFVYLDAPDIISGLIIGTLFSVIISNVKWHIGYKKGWEANAIKTLENEYIYEIYDNHFTVKILKNNETITYLKINFDDIKSINQNIRFIIINNSANTFIIKKDSVPPESVLYSLSARDTVSTSKYAPKNKLYVVSNALFVLSILSIFGALTVTAVLTAINEKFINNLWVFFLFTPIPISSVVLGFYLNKKGFKAKKNIICGIVMTALLCIYGSFVFLFPNNYSDSDQPILKAEERIEIDITQQFSFRIAKPENSSYSI